MSVEPFPTWLVPPHKGFVAEDLDRLPGLPPHTEMIDGSLVLVTPQALFHMSMISLLEYALRTAASAEFRVRREMTVTLAPRQRPEPDLMITRATGDRGFDQTDYRPEDVALVIEVVSPESRERDKNRKPSLYAEAGILHFWLVEKIEGKAAVSVYELVPDTQAYKLTGTYHDRLELTMPFPIDIDLTKIDRF
ncbi:MAG TPA: Uma2 family endonuclease [Actinocrinis sp.]|nr:Uma2 family endonuclease [Actinocrinis sp.]